MNTELPILVVPDEFKPSKNNLNHGLSIISNLGTLQIWIANNVPGNTSETIYVFDSQNLSNIVATYNYADQLSFHNSSSGSFTITTSRWLSRYWSQKDFPLWFYYVFRITETQFSNCNDTNFVNFAFPFGKTFILNAAANSSGNCLSSILIPCASPSYYYPSLPNMYISSINYVGPSSVKVLSIIHNESYELFEFSEEESKYWGNLVIYGNLINFVIPPNGALKIGYKSLESATNITEYDFEEYGLGVVQSSNYTINASVQYTPRLIKCTKGVAEITITLIYVEIPVGGY
jgi:hypothetical protein